ncbi:MAG: sulfite exporter TauE/SafE family protein [Betaproteobacteria bacterium]|jgi:sulfite exporter TauE/SafE|nr:sulfite exporter TauE/SafE family protein [Betaproteobacteria bacterium]
MQTSLAFTALIMGLAGGPHCVAMCGAACAGMGQVAGAHQNRALLSFQLGRWLGYSLMGGLAAFSVQALGWLTVESAALRPVWSMLHVAAVVLGLLLIWQAKQPVWLDQSAQQLWAKIRRLNANLGKIAPMAVGALWALMPCGLLYSALMVAALTGNVLDGALTMASFALGSGVSLGMAPWLLLKLKNLGDGAWGIRLAGLALASTSGWALWMGLVHNQAPWCVAIT